MPVLDLETRIARHVDRDGPRFQRSKCWLWTGSLDNKGYARISYRAEDGRRRSVAVHRITFEQSNGPIADGLEIDHLCRRRNCVRPLHLEAVSHIENLRRGIGVWGGARASKAPSNRGKNAGSFNRSKSRCSKGHPYSGANLYLHPSGRRQCRACQRTHKTTYRRKVNL